MSRLKKKIQDVLNQVNPTNPEVMRDIMNKIPTGLLIKFFIANCKQDQLQMLYNEYKMTGQTKKIKLLESGYYKKYRKKPVWDEI